MSDRLRKAAQAFVRAFDEDAIGGVPRAVAMDALRAALAEPEPGGEPLRIVFDGPPSHESGRFVEVESMIDGRSVGAGEWTQAGAFWHLGPLFAAPPDTVPREVVEKAIDFAARWESDPCDCEGPKDSCHGCESRRILAAYRAELKGAR